MDKIKKIICYLVVLLMLIVTLYLLNSNDIGIINYTLSIFLNLLILYNELFIIESDKKKFLFLIYLVIILGFYIWYTTFAYILLSYLLIGILQFVRFQKNKLFIIYLSFIIINVSLYIKVQDKLVLYKKLFISDFIFILASIFIFLIVYMIEQNDKLENSKKKILHEKIKSDYAYEQLDKAYGQLENYTILKERDRIAREMHDTIGHKLTMSLVQLENFSMTKLKDEDKNEFKEIIDAVRDVLFNIRTTTHAIKEEVDLWLEIDKLIDNINEKGIVNINYSRDNFDNVLVDKVKCIYNLIQETITNGIKHGQATAFIIAIKNMNDNIVIRIINNGIGASAYKKGFGLSSMEERIISFYGSLDIDTAIGEGFTITAYIPRGNSND